MQCSTRTINNYAIRNDIKTYKAVVKPPLTDFHKTERLAFATEMIENSAKRNSMIYFDEKLFNFSPTNSVVLVRCKKNELYNDNNIVHKKRPNATTNCNIGRIINFILKI